MKEHDGHQRDGKRIGIPTASHFGDIITYSKRVGWHARPLTETTPRRYLAQLVGEQHLGRSFDRSLSHVLEVQHGISYEPYARAAFTKATGIEVLPCGFFTDDAGQWGCSPDGIARGGNYYGRGAVEIKCPYYADNQLYAVVFDPVDQYMPQLQGQCLIGRFDYVHLFSWHPDLPPKFVTVRRDDTFCEMLEQALVKFCAELKRLAEETRPMFKDWLQDTIDTGSRIP